MKFLKRIGKGITKANNLAARAASLMIFPLILVLVFEIFMRFVLNKPTIYSYDLSWMMYAAFVFLGSGYVLAQNMHVKADFLYNKMRRRGKIIVNALCYPAFFFLSMGGFLYSTFWLAVNSWKYKEAGFWTSWDPPLWPLKAMLFVSFILLTLQGTVKFVEFLRQPKDGDGA